MQQNLHLRAVTLAALLSTVLLCTASLRAQAPEPDTRRPAQPRRRHHRAR